MRIEKLINKLDDSGGVKKFKQYHYDHFDKFQKYATVKGKQVGVMGCSTGLDCQLIKAAGASKVYGVDLNNHRPIN